MTRFSLKDSHDSLRRLKWLIWFRAFFALVLLVSTFIFCTSEDLCSEHKPFIFLYGISFFLLFLSLIYSVLLIKLKSTHVFIYFQLFLDSFIVTIIICITGGFSSIFTFLYLLVIISASMLLFRRGSMVIALCCSLQYGVLIDLEYFGIVKPFGHTMVLADSVAWTHVIYRIVIIMGACFAVAFLSGILALQAKRARGDLKVMEGHLRRVKRMAAMGELASSIAHEIRNPLASLSGAIQLLKEDTDPGSANYRLMKIVLRETERLSKIVSDFLVFAKPQKIDTENLRLDQSVKEIVSLFRQDPVCRKGIEIKTKINSPVWVNMEQGHLRQVLWNLLKNAAEAIKENGVIQVKVIQYRNDRVHLTIMDNGSGIRKEDIDSLFDPFVTTKASGTGLGLSIVHRIIDTYQGMIDLETEWGRGTVFTLILNSAPQSESGAGMEKRDKSCD
ncbi:MAG: ATP-binding protein [Thermodesulfobacteriota bacterium]|nr:ATP-binding protein [Thermodesulfobacteriota bacterium]